MSNQDPWRTPQGVRCVWWYTNPHGLSLTLHAPDLHTARWSISGAYSNGGTTINKERPQLVDILNLADTITEPLAR